MSAWRTHLENRAFLEFMAKGGTFQERQQAVKELAICARKLAFWERHPEFDKTAAAQAQREVGVKWSSKPKRR